MTSTAAVVSSHHHHHGKRGESTKTFGVYIRSQLTSKISLKITEISKDIKKNVEKKIVAKMEGRCIAEGYVKSNSVNIITYSSGIISRGINITFQVVFECDVCFPVEGMLISCVAKNITKAGIKAESANEMPSPIIVFIAKDHHFNMDYFSEIQEGDKFTARVIGQRFELNDKYISIIAELVKPKIDKKPRILIDEM